MIIEYMDKESLYLLQKIDCNCNDCTFMNRDFDKLNHWTEFHKKLQLNEFQRKRGKLIEAGQIKEAEKMIFQFDNANRINYGNCSKFNKPVSFLPNTFSYETQECFSHRKDNVDA